MGDWIAQLNVLIKVGLCGLPVCVGLYAACELAHRRKMPRAEALWRVLGRVALSACLLGVLGGLLGLAVSEAFFGVLNPGESPAWGVYLSVLASLLVIVSSFLLFRGESSAIPMGLSGRGLSSPK